jgi:purine-nucleoside phosphorylase
MMSKHRDFHAIIDTTIRAELPLYLQSPRVGIICGSGLSSIVTMFHKVVKIPSPYAKILGFSKVQVSFTIF